MSDHAAGPWRREGSTAGLLPGGRATGLFHRVPPTPLCVRDPPRPCPVSLGAPFPSLGLSFLMSEMGGLQLLVSKVPHHWGWGTRDISMSRKECQSSGDGYLSQD